MINALEYETKQWQCFSYLGVHMRMKRIQSRKKFRYTATRYLK